MKTFLVPVREPELVQAEANRHWRGDRDKVPTTSLTVLMERGIEITSRYRKANEFSLMAEMVRALDKFLVPYVDTLCCDSKATNSYHAALKYWDEGLAVDVARTFEAVAIKLCGGHNGITVSFGDGCPARRIDLDPTWPDLEREGQ